MNNQDTSSPIKFTPGKDSSYSSSTDVGTRPTGDPKSRKDFKKILDKTDETDEDGSSNTPTQGITDEGDDAIAMDDAVSKKKGPPSLFDLTSGRATQSETAAAQANNKFGKIVDSNTADAKTNSKSNDSADAPFSMNTVPEKDKYTTRFATEQPDLSYVNPMAAISTQSITETGMKVEKPVAPVVNIQEIINQLVSKVEELKQDGRTETTITLKQPPMFAGTNIVVTAFDSAKGEFNISFENLTQAAKAVLDAKVNRDSLIQDLGERGYAIHIVTTTTLVEHAPIIADSRSDKDQSRRQDRDPEQRRQRHPG